jgi:transcriptional regulator of acetoin/glycerol metabolism
MTNWNKSKAARLLHMPRPRLLRKIAKYGLHP